MKLSQHPSLKLVGIHQFHSEIRILIIRTVDKSECTICAKKARDMLLEGDYEMEYGDCAECIKTLT